MPLHPPVRQPQQHSLFIGEETRTQSFSLFTPHRAVGIRCFSDASNMVGGLCGGPGSLLLLLFWGLMQACWANTVQLSYTLGPYQHFKLTLIPLFLTTLTPPLGICSAERCGHTAREGLRPPLSSFFTASILCPTELCRKLR